MSDKPAPINNLPAIITEDRVAKLVDFLKVRHDAAVADLKEITVIDSDEQAEEVTVVLSQAKLLYDVMSAERKQFTDPVKAAIEEIMSYENAINYTAKSENEYNRARKVLEDYNQKKLEAANLAKHEAWLKAEQMKYKAEFKAKIQQQLSEMLTGLNKTVVQSMVDWEGKLTLENIDVNSETLKKHQPKLKQEHYDKCFHVWGQRPDVMAKKEEEEYLVELKKELTYEMYDEKFQLIVAPIKNEYLAKIPEIKTKLQEIAAANAEAKAAMEKKRAAELAKQREESLKAVDTRATEEAQTIQDQKALNEMEADFTQQAMTQDIKAPAKKLVASFADNKLWLKPLLAAISKVATSPKFKGILDKSGEPKKEVQWFLDQYASLVGEPLEGIKLEEEAKTFVRKK